MNDQINQIKGLINTLEQFIASAQSNRIAESAVLTAMPEITRLSGYISPLVEGGKDLTSDFISQIDKEASKGNALTKK